MDGIIEYPLIKPEELAGQAWTAMGRQEADEALRLWQALREHFPERPDGHIWPILVLWENARFGEAEAMAAAAFARFPNHPELLVQHAWIATSQQRWEEAAPRWAAVRRATPEQIEGYLGGARALWQSGQWDEAEALAAEAVRRFPGDALALVESAWTATARQDWEEALRRWMLLHEAYPERIDGRTGIIQALRVVGRIDESEALATASLAEHPDNTELLIEHVWTAAAREDWPEAAVRLERARSKQQDLAQVERSLGAIADRIRTLGAASAAEAPAEPASPAILPASESVPDDDEISPSALMLSFENIGERCDFGAVQRHFGVEPLGLLRFAYGPLDPLIAALDDRFDAVGTIEDTGFEAFGDETILRMKKYDLIFHTFVYEIAKEPPEKREAFYQQQRRRLVFLKNKLIGDLEEPQKICIYSTDKYASDDDVARLFAALRAYGPNSLLYVRPARGDRPEGTVETLEDGLYAGYFPGLADFTGGGQPLFELWRQLCARTHRLAKAGSAGNGFLKSLI